VDVSNILQALGLIGLLLVMLLGAAGIVLTVLWILTPFSVFAMRKRLDEQQLLLARIEKHLATIAEKDSTGGRPLPPI
jgi:ABC-type spermidine/putrescine transport system permease subunit I